MILPKVTGTKLHMKPAKFKLVKSIELLTNFKISWSVFASIPAGIKYMFATECSKPRVTKAVIGTIMAKILSVTVWQAKHNHTAKQIRVLHKIPEVKACIGNKRAS